MPSGRKTLHSIDAALAKARRNLAQAAEMPRRVSDALADVSRRQRSAFEIIARERLGLIQERGAADRIDKHAEKLLAQHGRARQRMAEKAEASLEKITDLESQRRAQEQKVEAAISAYDKGALATQNALATDPEYQALIGAIEDAEAMTARAEAKQEQTEDDVETKGLPYRSDPYFRYLQERGYGTKNAKGGPITKLLDGWIARRGNYREAALNYRRLTDIPKRLAAHVEYLIGLEDIARGNLAAAETAALKKAGVTRLKQASIKAQTALERLDEKLAQAEDAHAKLRRAQADLEAGESGPYQEAINLLVSALARKDMPDLRTLAAQTVSRTDDRAVGELAELTLNARDLKRDQQDARRLMKKYQEALDDIEQLRRRFKARRYDAPSSDFGGGTMISKLLLQLLAGAVSSGDVWRQIERAQRTVRRHTDIDFGDIDWQEAMRLPRSPGGFGGRGGGYGGGRSRRRSSRRTSSRPAPRPRSRPRSRPTSRPSSRPRRSSGGGFKTRGGF